LDSAGGLLDSAGGLLAAGAPLSPLLITER
jgi:hypothetical protein